MEKQILCGKSPVELVDEFGKYGLTMDHALKICNNVYKKSTASLTDVKGVPLKILRDVANEASPGIYPPESAMRSADGTVKYLFVNRAGQKFETVFIPEKNRRTLCISSQSGCRMGCSFCATGKYGFHGNLTTADILNQLHGIPESGTITHVVFMGMGEPMDNPGNVLKACEVLTAGWGFAISRRNITVSSVGITPAIREFLQHSECNLAVSLFTPFPEERIEIVPAERKYPVAETISLMKDFQLKKKRRLTLSYVMIAGVNDSDRHLGALRSLLADTGIRINLLPYHPAGENEHISSTPERLQYFRHNLVISGINASVRKSRGEDISAACGLLAARLTSREMH